MKASELYKRGIWNEASIYVDMDGTMEITISSRRYNFQASLKAKNLNRPDEEIISDEEVEVEVEE